MIYGAGVWRWEKHARVEQVQMTYVKWMLGLKKSTPNYVVLKKTKRDKLVAEVGRRAIRFEERKDRREDKVMLYECLRYEDKRATGSKGRIMGATEGRVIWKRRSVNKRRNGEEKERGSRGIGGENENDTRLRIKYQSKRDKM